MKTFSEQLRDEIERVLARDFHDIRDEAIRRYSETIDRVMAEAVIKLIEVVTFDHSGTELRISVDTSKIKEQLNEKK